MTQDNARATPKEYYGKKAKVGIMWTGFRKIGREFVGIPTTMILARLLTPEEFGIATVSRIFLSLAEHATQVGLPAAMVRVKVLRPEHMSSSLVFSLAVGALAWLGLSSLAPWCAAFLNTPVVEDVLPISALAFLIAPWGGVARVPIIRDMRYGQLAAATWIAAVTQSLSSIIFAWYGLGFWGLVYGHLVGDTAGAAAKMYFSKWRPSVKFERQALKDLWSYGLGRQMKGLLLYAGGNVDNLIVGRVLGMTALGLYDKAFRSIRRITGRLDVGQGVAFRIFAIIHEDPARHRRAYRKLALARTVIACPLFLALVAVAPQLFMVLYGPQWLGAVPAFQILCGFAILEVMTSTAAMSNEAVGFIWLQVAMRAGYVVLVAVGVVVGVQFGVEGVALGVLGARVVLTLMVHALVRRTTGLGWGELAAPLVPALFNAAALAALLLTVEAGLRQSFPELPALTLLLLQALVATPVYLGLLLLSPFTDVRAIASETVNDFFPDLAKRFGAAQPST